jgi:DNA repair protein RadC
MTMHTRSNTELLAILLGERKAKKLCATTLTSLLFAKEGSSNQDVLTSPGKVTDYLKVLLSGLEHEVFVVLFLDSQHRLIAAEELFRGTLMQTSVYPREVVKRTLHYNAAAVIFAHNHPSGVAEPSKSDEMLTTALKQALSLVDVRVLDHFVVAGMVTVSFAERGLV